VKKQLITLLSLTVLITCSGLLIGDDAPATAAPATPQSSAPDHLIYLSGKESAWKDFPKTPALGSAVDLSDLTITLAAQAIRTDAQKTEADHDRTYSINLVNEAIDPAFPTKYPNIFDMLQKADNDEHFINSMVKKQNARLRPYVQHPLLVTPLFTVKDFSYPSGHASGSQLQARLLALLFPAQAEDVLKRSRQIADSRVVAGVHYTSDIDAGQNLGDLIFDALESNAKFKQDLAAAAAKDGITLK
jgi:acid phosphatase (class A)